MSFRTEFEKILLHLPNPATATLHAGFFVAAMLASLVPDNVETYQYLRKKGHQYTLDSNKRANIQRENIKRYTEMDKQAAQANKETATAVAPDIQQEAEFLKDERMTKRRSKSELKVLGAQEKGAKVLLATEEAQKISSAQLDTQYQVKEKETAHRSSIYSRLQEHLKNMSELNEKLTGIANELETTTKANIKTTDLSSQSIMKLNTTMGTLLEANLNLQKALDGYDRSVAEGEMDIEKEQAISQALLATLQAEKKMETVVATAQIKNKSELKQVFMADVADKNKQLDSLLGQYSKQTLNKLSELIQKQLNESQLQITALSSKEDVQTCEEHLNKLTTLLNKVEQISVEKIESQSSVYLRKK